MARFRFAVQVSTASSALGWRELARKIEDLGYSTLFVPDHFDEQLSPLVGLTVACEATSTLNVGTLVFDNDYRHPVVLAREVATLDLLSGGRFECGLGAGWMTTDYVASGIKLDSPKVRVERLEESIKIMKDMWQNRTSTFEGKHYKTVGAVGFPEPVSKPNPKIIIGGGSKKVLSLAGREADIIGINMKLAAGVIGSEVIAEAHPDKFDERYMWVKEAAGSRIDSLEIQCLTFMVQVVPNGDEIRDKIAPLFGITPELSKEVPAVLIGSSDEIIETLLMRRERWGYSYIVVHENEMEDFVPVLEKLNGQ